MTVHLLASLVALVLGAVALLLLVPACVLFVQVMTAVVARRPVASAAGAAVRPPVAVLMPAHDEALGIAASIRSVRPQLRPGDRLLVVADNCGDDTASIARREAAEVVERFDTVRRGKGYALDFGVRTLEADPRPVVIFVDSDCQVEAGAIDRLAEACGAWQAPVQALYLMRSPTGAGLKTRMAEFAWRIKNQVRPLGFDALGLPCQLTGTGMAFPWSIIATAPLASGHLVEDMQLGIDLASAGRAPRLCHEALVTSVFPTDVQGLATQRTRWEHGHMSVIAAVGPSLLARAVRRGDKALAAMTLDLCVPPLASLVLMLLASTAAAALLAVVSPFTWAFSVSLTGLLLVAVAIMLAWQRFGRDCVTLSELLTAPAYVLRKIPIYLKLFTGRQAEWVRTKRDGQGK